MARVGSARPIFSPSRQCCLSLRSELPNDSLTASGTVADPLLLDDAAT